MSTRVIDDPSALGWEYDSSTGRWAWGGGSSAGGDGGAFPEAPVDGKQYGRQNAGWTEIVHSGGGGGNDPRITNQQITNWDISFGWGNHSAAGYLKSESDPTVPDHVKSITPTDIANWNAGTGNGGGGGYDDTQIKADLARETQDRINGDANLQGQIDNLSGGGNPITTADVMLVSPTRLPSGLENQQDANAYIAESLDKLIDQDGNVIAGGIEEAPSDSVIYGRRNKDWVAVPTGGGGGGDVDLSAYYTAAQCDSKFEPKFTKNTAFNKNFGTSSTTVAQGNHTHSQYADKDHLHTGVYEPVFAKNSAFNKNFGGTGSSSSVARSDHDHAGVYQPVGSYLTSESDPTVPQHVKTISQSDINKWNNPPSGGGDDPNAVKLTGDQTVLGVKKFLGGTTYFQNLFIEGVSAGGVGIPGAARIEFSSGATTLYGSSNTLQVNATGTSIGGSIICTGTITGTDCIATSDERLKDNITTAPVGLIDRLQGREWDWKESGKTGSGVVAQELEKVLPHLVHTDEDGMKAVSYNGLIAYLIEEVKALKAEVETLRNG